MLQNGLLDSENHEENFAIMLSWRTPYAKTPSARGDVNGATGVSFARSAFSSASN